LSSVICTHIHIWCEIYTCEMCTKKCVQISFAFLFSLILCIYPCRQIIFVHTFTFSVRLMHVRRVPHRMWVCVYKYHISSMSPCGTSPAHPKNLSLACNIFNWNWKLIMETRLKLTSYFKREMLNSRQLLYDCYTND
jgi:hypothetical protein